MPGQNPIKVFETGTNQVVAGTQRGGWITGTPASLAAAASVPVIFDLGSDWDQYPVVGVTVNPVGPSSGFSAVQLSSWDIAVAVNNPVRQLKDIATPGPGALSMSLTTAGGPQQVLVRPMGRYLTISLTNADGVNALGATSRVAIAAFPV